ncbi:hypothetical protein CRG98_002526 [Punica granatum]|nr:hypothetical protein CRG98_002526 [Punica granatum]
MSLHNGYRTMGFKSQLVQVHPSSVLGTDDQGMFPEFVVYHELISTSRPYMRNVCAIEGSWVMPIMKKLGNLNVSKLSGGSGRIADGEEKASDLLEQKNAGTIQNDQESRIQAARERFLARKANK